jgi:hypothetical protein
LSPNKTITFEISFNPGQAERIQVGSNIKLEIKAHVMGRFSTTSGKDSAPSLPGELLPRGLVRQGRNGMKRGKRREDVEEEEEELVSEGEENAAED